MSSLEPHTTSLHPLLLLKLPQSHNTNVRVLPDPRDDARAFSSWGRGCRQLSATLGVSLLALLGLPTAANTLQPELEALQAFEQARTEIKGRRFERAEILLERVLMLQPEHAEARIELALLMAARGLLDSAAALLQSLIDDPRTEIGQVRELNNLLATMQQSKTQQIGQDRYSIATARLPKIDSQPGTTTATWRGEVNLGVSSNPMARTSAEAITITLPDGPLSLPLAQTQHAGLLVGAHLSRRSATSGAELVVNGTSVNGSSTAARAIVWGRVPLANWTSAALPPVLAFTQAQRGLDGQNRTLVGLSALHGAQRYTLSGYMDQTVGDRGLIARFEHQTASFLGGQWQTLIERSNSITGPRSHWRLGLTGEYNLNERAKLLIQSSIQNDSYGYSQLLENGARRQLSTVHVVYEQQHILEHEKIVVWRLFTGERRSNLSIFDYKEVGLQIGIVKKWL